MKNNKKYDLYFNAYYNCLMAYSEVYKADPKVNIKPWIKKLVTYAVKAVNNKEDEDSGYIERDQVESDFEFAELIKSMMATLTPKEFMQLFPIAKEYNGHKYEFKDYWYTINYLKQYDMDKPIGEDKITKFLWEYHNWELTDFNIELMEYISKIQQLDGGPSLASEFADIMGLKTYKVYTDEKGGKFLFDNETGKTMKLIKKRPRYLKLINNVS